MNFYLVFCKTRKKVDKYFKNNKIKNKQIIDIKKLSEEEEIKEQSSNSQAFFKILIWNKIKYAREKGKDIYYIPNFHRHDLDVKKLFEFKDKFLEEDSEFNLLLFYDEFIGTKWLDDIFEELDTFDNSQILKDY